MTKTWTSTGCCRAVGNGSHRTGSHARQALIARAKSLELNTRDAPPPGEPLEHYASGYAKIMCSAVFVTGLDPAFAAENVGYFTAPYAERARLGPPKIDREKRTVEVTMPNGTVRVAKQVGSQGCITLPIGRTDVFFKPSIVKSALPDPRCSPGRWASDACGRPARERGHGQGAEAVDAAFDPAGITAASPSPTKGRSSPSGTASTSRRPHRSRVGRWGRA